MAKLQILRSDNPKKKYKAIFTKDDGKTKTIHFGDSSYDDYTTHHDKDRRRLYRLRHDKDLQTNNPLTAGHLSMFILWGNSRDIQTNIRLFKNRFKFS